MLLRLVFFLVVHILFIISVICGFILVGATAAIVHHVRVSHRNGRKQQGPPAPSFEEHMKAAVKYGSPRSTRLMPHQTVRAISAQKGSEPASFTKDPASSQSQSGPHIVHRSTKTREHAGTFRFDQATATPSLRVVSGSQSASSKRF